MLLTYLFHCLFVSQQALGQMIHLMAVLQIQIFLFFAILCDIMQLLFEISV